jgi:putative addiction module component (TIGR02574 family)
MGSVTDAAKKLFEQAMTLPRDERERLAEALLASSGGDMPRDVEQAWVAEIGRRIARVRDGEAVAIPWAEARSQPLARLRER